MITKDKIICPVKGCKLPHLGVRQSPVGDYESEYDHPSLDDDYHYVHYSEYPFYLKE